MKRNHYRPKREMIHTRVEPRFKRDLLQLCEREGLTISDLSRSLLEAWASEAQQRTRETGLG